MEIGILSNTTRTLQRRTYLRSVVLLFIAAVAAGSAACRKSGNSTPASTDKTVEVSGTVDDEEPVEFTQADESVQIGGVNLISSPSFKVTAFSLSDTGSKRQVFTGVFPTSSFSFSATAARDKYLILDVVRSDGGIFAAVLPPPYDTDKSILKVDNTQTIAAKQFDVLATLAVAGDQGARIALSGYISVADALVTAQCVVRTVNQQKLENVPALAIDLKVLAVNLWKKSNENFEALAKAGLTISEAKNEISRATNAAVFGKYADSVSPAILAYRTGYNFGSGGAAAMDVAYEAIKAAADSSFNTVNAAFRTEATAYRGASSVEEAKASEPQVVAAYASIYRTCTVTDPANCISTPYTPPAPPAPVESSSGVGVPVHAAQGLYFTDADMVKGQIGGTVSIVKASDESDVTSYVLYWGSNATTKAPSLSQIREITTSGVLSLTGIGQPAGYSLTISIPSGTAIPSGATHLLVFTKNSSGEMASGTTYTIVDN